MLAADTCGPWRWQSPFLWKENVIRHSHTVISIYLRPCLMTGAHCSYYICAFNAKNNFKKKHGSDVIGR